MPINFRNPAALAAAAKGDIDNAIAASTPGGIERQEKSGQMELVASTNMPISMLPGRDAFEAIGFTFGEQVDELFYRAAMPAGWSRRASDHSMHSYIIDEQGRSRVSVFYKAAFYDRRATARLVPRYTVIPNTDGLGDGEVAYEVRDGADDVLYRSEVTQWDEADAAEKAAYDWLAARYPNANDPTAYW